jgi:hypothetical protein
MADSWDPEQDVEWHPAMNKVYVGGQPVKEPRAAPASKSNDNKLCAPIQFSFSSARLSELTALSDAGDGRAAHGFFALGIQYDKGSDGEKCLEKAFQCYKSAARDGFIPAIRLLQSRIFDAADETAYKNANGVYIQLCHASPTDANSNTFAHQHSRNYKKVL